MEIHLHNTMSGKTEAFFPITPGQVSMYHCGPTVYNYAHIGNMRAYIFTDTLRRLFEYNSYKVHQVMNITDIGHLSGDGDDGEDKMTSALLKIGKPLTLEALKELADFFTGKFMEDLKSLNIEIPQDMPKASENIDGDIALIKKLEEKGFTYILKDGVYFDTSKDKDYGKLGNIKMGSDDAKSRIGVKGNKKSPRDFCVWKLNDNVGWSSQWGKGFPGWHIECSVMSVKYLGETFDIHTGGIDHIPVHHNNEIAQSESASGKPLAHYWLHNNFVNINGAKLAKSAGNAPYVKDLEEMGISPLAYRYWLLMAHYRTVIDFTEESVKAAQTALDRIVNTVTELLRQAVQLEEYTNVDQKYADKFLSIVNDDLNTAQALALLNELLKNKDVSESSKISTIYAFDKVLGLNIKEQAENKLSSQNNSMEATDEVKAIIAKREEARANKDWKAADILRDELTNKGYDIKDEQDGPRLIKK